VNRNTKIRTKPYVASKEDIQQLIRANASDSLLVTISRPIANIPANRIDDIHCEIIASKVVELLNYRVLGRIGKEDFIRGIVVQERCHDSIFLHFHMVLRCPSNMPMDTFRNRLGAITKTLCTPGFKFDLDGTRIDYSLRPRYESCAGPDFIHVSECHDGLPEYLTKDLFNNSFRGAKVAILSSRSLNMHRDRLDLNDHNNYEEERKRAPLPYICPNPKRARAVATTAQRRTAINAKSVVPTSDRAVHIGSKKNRCVIKRIKSQPDQDVFQ